MRVSTRATTTRHKASGNQAKRPHLGQGKMWTTNAGNQWERNCKRLYSLTKHILAKKPPPTRANKGLAQCRNSNHSRMCLRMVVDDGGAVFENINGQGISDSFRKMCRRLAPPRASSQGAFDSSDTAVSPLAAATAASAGVARLGAQGAATTSGTVQADAGFGAGAATGDPAPRPRNARRLSMDGTPASFALRRQLADSGPSSRFMVGREDPWVTTARRQTRGANDTSNHCDGRARKGGMAKPSM